MHLLPKNNPLIAFIKKLLKRNRNKSLLRLNALPTQMNTYIHPMLRPLRKRKS